MRLTRYDLDKEVRRLRRELREIESLSGTLNSPGWKQVVLVFGHWIEKLTSEYMRLCDNPKGNDVEIRCKKMVSEALAAIISTLDSRITERDVINNQIKDIEQAIKKGT